MLILDTCIELTVMLNFAVFPLYVTVTSFVPAVLISGDEKVNPFVTTAVVPLLYETVISVPAELKVSLV